MGALGLVGARRDTGTRTTTQAKDGTGAGDLLDAGFSATAPNLAWAGDFTCVKTWAGFA